MNFFEHQELARRQSRRLVVLFVLAVLSIVLGVNFVATLAWHLAASPMPLPPYFHLTNTLVVLGLILGGSALEIAHLKQGGAVVATMVGGRRITREHADDPEKRLLNIVEEMAIASGISVPQVYVLDEELSINAFAAGNTPNDAVVAVSRGALLRLNRDETQGVVAHEFSHILNGDMQLNLRLVGLLYGLLLVAMLGEEMMSSLRHTGASSSREHVGYAAVLSVAGALLWGIGYVGVLAGRLIKAAISRQREFLADASAVQFTRNVDGIGGALRKIGGLGLRGEPGSALHHPKSEALSHMVLAAGRRSLVDGLLATHPPIVERVRRLYGRSMPMLSADLPEPALPPVAHDTIDPGIAYVPVSSFDDARAHFDGQLVQGRAVLVPDAAVHLVGAPHMAPSDIALAWSPAPTRDALMEALHHPLGAQAAVLALLLDADPEVARAQRTAIHDAVLTPRIDVLAPVVAALHERMRLPVVDMAIPALKTLDVMEREHFLAHVQAFIDTDGRMSLHEFVLQTLLMRRLGSTAEQAVPVTYRSVRDVPGDVALIVSLIAHTCARQAPARSATLRAEAASAQLGQTLPLVAASAIRKHSVADSLDRLNRLAPLQKPLAIKACVAAALDADDAISMPGADLVRAVCAALDAPMPPAVEAAYLGLGDHSPLHDGAATLPTV